ncbi:MAG: hypothetical protein ABJ056_12760 [Halioglobus sp.]
MRVPRIKTLLFALAVLFALFYAVGAFFVATDDRSVDVLTSVERKHEVVALFGASGTTGDGILKAALADPDIHKVYVITRRSTPRIEEGIAMGKVQMTQHMDYLDYAAIRGLLKNVDTVYWAIGISALGVDEETYGKIHVDFPMSFVQEWTEVNHAADLSFHFISSSDISPESETMWVREKIRAENTLFGLADGSSLRVIAYRPDYIGPTKEEAHLGQNLVYWFFRPVGAAVKASEIGRAMLEVTARGASMENGKKITTSGIIRYSEAYERRQSLDN